MFRFYFGGGGGYKVQQVGVYKVQQVRVYKVSLFFGFGKWVFIRFIFFYFDLDSLLFDMISLIWHGLTFIWHGLTFIRSIFSYFDMVSLYFDKVSLMLFSRKRVAIRSLFWAAKMGLFKVSLIFSVREMGGYKVQQFSNLPENGWL